MTDDVEIAEAIAYAEAHPPSPAPPVRPLSRARKLGQCCACGTGLYVARDAEDGRCVHCRCNDEDREGFMVAVATPLTRAEALDALRQLAGHKDPEHAHGAAEAILLQLLDDAEIAAAFYAVPRWYA